MSDSLSFIEIEDFKNDIIRIINEIDNKCVSLENIYKQYLLQATKSSEYLMSLDTLFFQINLTKKDIVNYSGLFNLFIYQMYGQYYKLYKKIIYNLSNVDKVELFKDVIYEKHFTPYDDLNFQEYSFEEIQSIHNIIISVMSCIDKYIQKQKYEIEDDNVRVNKGVSIDTLVFEKTHFTQILLNEYNLFNCILKKYYDYQKKILKRIMLKLKLLYFQIDTDIQFESFNYSPRQSVTANIDAKFKKIAKQEDFESILLEEFDPKPIVASNPFIDFFKMYIFKFFSKFCIF
tara:strand:+ start:32510 stop:33376 length:867 start_codon:yes stop_codon:yes gene_type:complete